MIRTGSSLVQAASAYRMAGATKVHAIASHLVLPGESLKKIRSSGVLENVWGTDSHPGCRSLPEEDRISIAPLFAKALAR